MSDTYSPMPVEDMSDAQNKVAMELLNAINSMANKDSLLIPSYLLRIQLLEFNLKHLWRRYGFHKEEVNIYKWTLGQTVRKLKELEDNYFNNLVSKLEDINKLRNLVVHHILDEDKTLNDIKSEVQKQFVLIDDVQQEIGHYLEWDMSFRV